jgi:serine/threonine protein kinase
MSHDHSEDSAFRPPSLEELGALLPQFEMQEFLAHGGMGAVYLARQISLDRLVAIKVLPAAWGAEAGYAQLFQTEARAMAKLHHNHIVGVFDFGITAEGHLYLVMEYVPGQTLHDMIRLKKLPLVKVQGLALQLCDALAYAHEHGVLHRDIKPGNVLVSSSGEVKIADFGLARHAGAAVEETSLGTPDYAAPELFATGAMVDHRADIFAMGIVFQEMLTGQVPRRPREPLSEHGVFDPGWEPVIAKATHQNPAHRFRTVREMREAVVDVAKRPARTGPVRTGPVRTGPTPPAMHRPRSFAPPPPEPSTFPWASIIAVLVIGTVAGVWWWRNRTVAPSGSPQASAPATTQTQVSAPPSTPAGAAPATSTPAATTQDPKPPASTPSPTFTPGTPFKLDPVPPGHVFKVQEGHKDVIYDVAVFPDQRHVATASADGTIGVWDLQTSERIRTFGPVEGSVLRVAVSPDSRAIAAGGSEYKAYVWNMDAAPGATPKEVVMSARSIPYVAFSADGAGVLLGTSDANQSIVVWDWQKGTTEVVPGFRSSVNGLDVAPGLARDAFVVMGNRFDAGQYVTEAWQVDLPRRSLAKQLTAPAPAPYRMKVLPDGRTGIGMLSGRIVTWDMESGRILMRSNPIPAIVGDLELLDEGRLLLFGAQDRCLHIMETATGKDLWTSAPTDTQCTNTPGVLSGGRYAVTAGGWRTGNPMQKDGDNSLHAWALPELSSLKSGEAERAIAVQQLLALDKKDPELHELLTRLNAEWAEKAIVDTTSARKDLDEKYLGAVRREMSTASPRDREAFLSEISRIANGGTGVLAAGAPPSLIRLHEIYQQQIALVPQKAQSIRAELSTSHQDQLGALDKKRAAAGDVPGAARVRVVKDALTALNGEMVIAKVQDYFLPKKQETISSVTRPSTTSSFPVTSTTIVPGVPPPPAVGDLPPYTAPLRGLSRPTALHRVVVWPRTSNITPVQTGLSKVPADLGPVVALGVGQRHAIALKPDGTVVQWGTEDNRVLGVPEGVNRIVAVDASSFVSACLRDDGVVIAWNTRQILPQRNNPRPAVDVTATFSYALERHEDGSLTYLGSSATTNNSAYSPPPDLTGCVQVCAANSCAFALKKDGTVVGWGRSSQANAFNMTDTMPTKELVNGLSIASLSDQGFLLKRTGEIVAWGQNVPVEMSNKPRFPGATRILGGRPYTGLAIGFQPGVWKFLSFPDGRSPIDTETADRMARGCTEIGIGQYFILGLRPL